MKRKLLVALGSLLLPAVSVAQNEFHHNNVEAGLGAATPVGSDTSYLQTAPLINIGYGYRFNRLFQADAGFQIAFGAVNNQNVEVTDMGNVQGGDHEFMIPLGGRVYIPQPFKRFEISAGGGAAYLHYSETISSGGGYYYTPTCYTCTSRGGWGGYGMGNISYYLDSNHNFRVGTTIQFISGTTNGQPVGSVPGNKTTDHWLNAFVVFGLSF